MKKVRNIIGIAALLLATCTLHAQTIPGNVGPTAATMPAALQNVGFEPPLNGQMPLDLAFRETPQMAAEKKKKALARFRRPETDSGWHFLTGSQESIEAATRAANFRFSFDAKSSLFAHASGVMVLTSDGRISRYFYGVEYPGRDMRLGLVDASAGRIGTPIDHVLLYCYHYDPSSARYSASILKIIR